MQAALQNYNAATGGQNDLIGSLQQIISGQGGPNLADQELRAATDRNARSAAAAIASQQGLNPGLAARQIANTTAGLSQAETGQAAEARLQQELASQGLLAQILGQKAGGATNLYGTAGQLQNLQNAGQISQQGLNQGAYAENMKQTGGLASGLASAGVGAATGGLLPTGATTGGDYSIGGHFAHGGTVDDDPKAAFLDAYRAAHAKNPHHSAALLLAYHAGRKDGEPEHMADGGELTAEHRDALPDHAFALPGRRYPIHDANHARNALARVSQHGTPEEKAKVRAAVHKRYPEIGKADGGEVEHLEEGGAVGGPEPVVSGDDERNDRTPAMLTAGERVIPRTIAHDPEATARFIKELNRRERAKHAMKRSPAHLMAGR